MPDKTNIDTSISEVTRRKIFDHLEIERIRWSGRRDELAFLASLYDLQEMPSTDYRPQYPTAYEDIHKHRVMNDDWGGHYWVFTDPRFNLLWCSDEVFLKFICEMLHPTSWVFPQSGHFLMGHETQAKAEDKGVSSLQAVINEYLKVDGWEIYVDGYISGEPLFSFRTVPLKNAPLEKVKALAEIMDSPYISRQISRLSESAEKDPEAAIGASKEFLETIFKYIIKAKGGSVPQKADLNELGSSARNLLNLLPKNIDNEELGGKAINKVLKGVGSVISGVAELRNLYGTGHGKDSQSIGVAEAQAHLVVGLVASVGKFIFDVHTENER